MIAIALLLLAFGISAQAHGAVGVRLVFGLGDTGEVKWDGSVTADRARITSIEGWRFEGSDAIIDGNAWRASTHRIRLFGGGLVGQRPFVANGVIVWLADENAGSELKVKTAH